MEIRIAPPLTLSLIHIYLIWAGGYYNLKSYDLDTKEMHCYNMDFPITYITNKDAHNLWTVSYTHLPNTIAKYPTS